MLVGRETEVARLAERIEERRAVAVFGEAGVGKTALCPWHKWEFEIATGRCLVDDKLRVRTYGVRVDAYEVVVSLERKGAGAL